MDFTAKEKRILISAISLGAGIGTTLVKIALLLALSGCMIDELFKPVPYYVWACIRKDYLILTDIQTGAYLGRIEICLEQGWTRRVDTIPYVPEITP